MSGYFVTTQQLTEVIRLKLDDRVGAPEITRAVLDSGLVVPAQALAEANATIARLDEWLGSLEAAAGMGSLAEVANHQRARGLVGDNESRLRSKRVDRLRALVLEEAGWRHQVLTEAAAELRAAEAQLTQIRDEIDTWPANAAGWADRILRALDGTP